MEMNTLMLLYLVKLEMLLMEKKMDNYFSMLIKAVPANNFLQLELILMPLLQTTRFALMKNHKI